MKYIEINDDWPELDLQISPLSWTKKRFILRYILNHIHFWKCQGVRIPKMIVVKSDQILLYSENFQFTFFGPILTNIVHFIQFYPWLDVFGHYNLIC